MIEQTVANVFFTQLVSGVALVFTGRSDKGLENSTGMGRHLFRDLLPSVIDEEIADPVAELFIEPTGVQGQAFSIQPPPSTVSSV